MSDHQTETYVETRARKMVEHAEALQAEAERDRDKALKELAETKEAIAWTMGQLKISDIIFHSEVEDPNAHSREPLTPDLEDTARICWINKNGRVGLGTGSVTIALPYFGGDDEVPFPFNIRHLIDICRK
jgi:hypothetical protein